MTQVSARHMHSLIQPSNDFKVQNFIYNHKFRYIHRRYNTDRQLPLNVVISINFVASKDNLTDPFTKCLSGEHINYASKGMGLKT